MESTFFCSPNVCYHVVNLIWKPDTYSGQILVEKQLDKHTHRKTNLYFCFILIIFQNFCHSWWGGSLHSVVWTKPGTIHTGSLVHWLGSELRGLLAARWGGGFLIILYNFVRFDNLILLLWSHMFCRIEKINSACASLHAVVPSESK